MRERERVIVSQTKTGTVSKATSGKLLRDGVASTFRGVRGALGYCEVCGRTTTLSPGQHLQLDQRCITGYCEVCGQTTTATTRLSPGQHLQMDYKCISDYMGTGGWGWVVGGQKLTTKLSPGQQLQRG